MCGRYTYYSSVDLLDSFKFLFHDDTQTQLTLDVPDNYNVSPGNEMPVIIRGSQAHKIEMMIWGLLPSWTKEPHTKLKLINARKEGLLVKPMWKRLVTSRRCIVPARGFYEWKTHDGKKRPYYITMGEGRVMSFAGLWDEWTDGKTTIKTYTIITTEPNKEMSDIHNRMPVILNHDQMQLWLGPLEVTPSLLNDLLRPLEDNSLNIVEVSPAVNNAKLNTKELIYPLE